MAICPIDIYKTYTDECISCSRRMECMLVLIMDKLERLETTINSQKSLASILEK